MDGYKIFFDEIINILKFNKENRFYTIYEGYYSQETNLNHHELFILVLGWVILDSTQPHSYT